MIRSQFLAGLGATHVALFSPSTSTATINIAVVVPLSGAARQIGLQVQAGAEGAVQEYNDYGLTLNATTTSFGVRAFDDQNSVADGILQAQFATGDTSVIAGIGHLSADVTINALPTWDNAQCPLIVPLSTDDRITAQNRRCVFRLQTKDSTEGFLFARAVAKQFQPKIPYVLVQDADYGADVANGFIDGMNQAKTTTPYQQFSYDKPDFDAVATKTVAAAPDYVFLAGNVGHLGGVVPALRQKGYTGPIGASQGFFDADTLKLGAAADGMMISTSMPDFDLAPTTARLRADYEPHFGAMTPYAAFGYAAAQLIVATFQRTGASTRTTMLSALQTLAPAVSTLVGDVQFGVFGDEIDPQIYFYTIRGGKIVYLHQAHPSTYSIK